VRMNTTFLSCRFIKMNKLLNYIWLGCVFIILKTSVLGLETSILDFTQGHSLEVFKKSGIHFQEDKGRPYGEKIFFSNQKVIIVIPGGRKFEQKVENASLFVLNGQIQEFEMNGGNMPDDQAYEVGKLVHKNLGLPLDELDQWYSENKGKGYDLKAYSISNSKIFPAIGIRIKPSIGNVYPCKISFVLTWNLKTHEGWNEERAAKENPLASSSEVVSLEPPNGKTYSREESAAPLRKEQEEYEKKYYQEHPINASPQNAVPPAPTQPEPPRVVADTNNQTIGGKEVEGLQLSLQVKKTDFQSGEPILATVQIKNNRKVTASVSEREKERDFVIVVTDINRNPVPRTDYGSNLLEELRQVLRNIARSINPGESLIYEIEVSQQFQVGAPGEYFITVSRDILKESGDGVFKLVSNTIKVRVLPK